MLPLEGFGSGSDKITLIESQNLELSNGYTHTPFYNQDVLLKTLKKTL